MAYTEAMKCLAVETTKNKNVQREDRVHGGLLLLNELLRVSDVKFEVCFVSTCKEATSCLFRVSVKTSFIRTVHRNPNLFPTKYHLFLADRCSTPSTMFV